MPLERARYDVAGQTLIVLGLPDRRARGDQDTLWCFQKTLELCLFGSNSSAIHRLLERCSLQTVRRKHRKRILFALPPPFDHPISLHAPCFSGAAAYR
jgi:hypothetical protein